MGITSRHFAWKAVNPIPGKNPISHTGLLLGFVAYEGVKAVLLKDDGGLDAIDITDLKELKEV